MAFWVEGEDAAEQAALIAEGVLLNSYCFDKYKSNKNKSSIKSVEIIVPKAQLAAAKKSVARAQGICAGVNFARDLVMEPHDVIYPDSLAKAAQKLAREGGMQCTILNDAQLRKQGYNGLITVGKGSPTPPRMIILRYNAKSKSKEHIALVGKGITFDTGGISLKSAPGMWQMKGDMGGSAAVLGAMKAIGKLKPKAKITAIVATAHNAIGPHAVHPGDVFTAKMARRSRLIIRMRRGVWC